MDFTLPEPPPNSCFVLDEGDYLQPRLTWNYPGRSIYCLRIVLAVILSLIWLAVPASGCIWVLWHAEIGWLWFARILFGCICVGPLWLVVGLALTIKVVDWLRPPRPTSITLGAAWLDYDPGGAGPKYQFGRWQIEAVRLEQVKGKTMLTMQVGTRSVDIGRTLTHPEREWLVEVLRAYAPKQLLSLGKQP